MSVIKWGYLCKMHFSSLFPPHFLPTWKDKKSGSRRENFISYFLSLLFSFLNQIVENNIFHLIFFSLFSIFPIFTPTKHSLKDILKLQHPPRERTAFDVMLPRDLRKLYLLGLSQSNYIYIFSIYIYIHTHK